MSGLIPITVNTPPGEEAHIHAEDDASVYLSLFGGDGVSTNGQSCKATVLSNNKVRIADGIICVGGHFARIPYGDYLDCEIDSGQSGKNRNDIIVARIKTTGTGGIDTYTCEVKKGTAGSTATDPEIVQEDLYKAGKVRELPLYRVKIEGLSITAVEQLFTLRKTNEELEKELESLNSKIITTDRGTCIKHANGVMEQFIKAKVLTKTFSAWGSCYYASTPAVDYIEPFVTVIDADVRIEADGQAWTMGVDNGTLKQSPSVYALRPNSPGGQLWVTVRVHAIGTWK